MDKTLEKYKWHISIHPWPLIIYVIWIIIFAFLWKFFENTLSECLLFLAGFIGVASFADNLVLFNRIKINMKQHNNIEINNKDKSNKNNKNTSPLFGTTLSNDEEEGLKSGDISRFDINIKKPFFLISLNLRFFFNIKNTFYGTSIPMERCVPLPIGEKINQNIYLESQRNGILTIELIKWQLTDLMGITTLEYSQSAKEERFYFPEGMAEGEKTLGFMQGITQSQETSKKGSDSLEMKQIREYHEGDRIRDIHWKLTAKKQKLMVKEREAVSQEQMVMVVGWCDDININDDIVTYSYQLANRFINDGTMVSIYWWSQKAENFENYVITKTGELNEAYIHMYRMPPSDCQPELIKAHMRALCPLATSYVLVNNYGEEIKAELIEN